MCSRTIKVPTALKVPATSPNPFFHSLDRSRNSPPDNRYNQTSNQSFISKHESITPTGGNSISAKVSAVCPNCGYKVKNKSIPNQRQGSVFRKSKIEPVPLPAELNPTLLLDNSPTPQLLLSDDNAVVYANRSATRLLHREVIMEEGEEDDPSTGPPPRRQTGGEVIFGSIGSRSVKPTSKHDSGIEGLLLEDLPMDVARVDMRKWISLEQVFKVVKNTILKQKDQDMYGFDAGAYSEYYDTGKNDDDYYGEKETDERAEKKKVDEYSRNETIPVIITKQDGELLSASLYISLLDSNMAKPTSFVALSIVPNSDDVDAGFNPASRRTSGGRSRPRSSGNAAGGAGREIVEKVAKLKEMILDEMEYSFTCITPDREIVITNKACRKLLGGEASKLPVSEGYDWISQMDLWRPDFSERLPFEEWCMNKVFTTKDSTSSTVGLWQGNKKRIFDFKGTPLWEKPEKKEGLLAGLTVVIEQTERADREQEILRSGEVRRTFLMNLSRRLKTPLAGVVALLELLYEIQAGKEQRALVRDIFSGVNTLLLVINDLIDFNKIEAGDLKVDQNIFVLQHLVGDIETLFRESMAKEDVDFLVNTTNIIPSAFGDGTKLLLKGDDGKIRRIVINLLSNAYKFTPQGTVALKVVTQKVQKGSLELRFEISDTGIGISEENMRRLFLPFHEVVATDISTAAGHSSTGFGLTIAKSLSTLMRGDMGCRSVVDKGSTFWFSVPCTRPPQDAPVTIPRKEDSLSHNMGVALRIGDLQSAIKHDSKKKTKVVIEGANVMVVEDNWSHQVVMQKRLEKLGCNVEVAVNGQNAISKMKKGELKLDIVFMDLQMPLLDGYETTAIIRKAEDADLVAYKDVPIIAVTATEMMGDRDRAREAGINDFMLKPLHNDSLKQIMERFLDPGRTGDFCERHSVDSFKPRKGAESLEASPGEPFGLEPPAMGGDGSGW